MGEPVVGSKPSAEEDAAFDAAAHLAPDKSLTRIQELAKFVFANVAVVGILLTGLGLFTDLGEVLESSWTVPWAGDVPLAVAALGLSLAAASFAVWPKMSSVDLTRLDEVNAWYGRQIVRRGFWMIVSLALFSTAILLATFTGSGSLDEPEKPSISASWTGTGKDATVKVTVKAEKVPDDWTMVTETHQKKASGKVLIFRDQTRPSADGELTVAGEVGVGESVGRIESVSRLYSGEDLTGEAESETKLTLKR
jgi:hypothetical protein